MPATAQALRAELTSHTSNNQDLQAILLRDPAATIALYRRLDIIRPGAAEGIGDPAHAIAMIGLQAFEELIDQLPEAGEKHRLSPLLHQGFAYSQAAHTAFFAQALGERLKMDNTKEIAVAGLLQNPAILALWHQDRDSAARATNAMRDGVPFDLAFSAEMGEPLKQANSRLARAWHLPRMAQEAAGNWDPFNRRLQAVAVADMLAQTGMAAWQVDSKALNCEILEEMLGQPNDAVCAWWHRAAATAAQQLAGMNYPLAAFELLTIPGGETDVDIPPLPARIPKTSKNPARQGLQESLAALMRRAQKETGIKRAIFGMLNQDRTEVKARLALGGNREDPMRRFAVPLKNRTLFSSLLSKQQSIWIHAGNRAKYTPLLKGLPLDGGSTRGFYAMSIFAQEKPLGLLYVDGGELNENGYRHFRKICHEFSQLLGSPSKAA
jgi:hypothetical protein